MGLVGNIVFRVTYRASANSGTHANLNEKLAHTVGWKCTPATYHAETETASRNSTHKVMNTLNADLGFEATIMECIHHSIQTGRERTSLMELQQVCTDMIGFKPSELRKSKLTVTETSRASPDKRRRFRFF